ncbi:zinc finger, CCHC-type containing protein [Tanacetum coccineum]
MLANDTEGLESSSNIVKNSTVNKEGVSNVYVKFCIDVDSNMAGQDKPHDENVGQTLSNSTANPNKGTSYANLFTGELNRKSVNFRSLITPAGNGIDVAVPVESVRAICQQNTWGKYGLVKSMLNSSTGLFLFQFSSMDGLDSMLDNGSWFIRNNPLILKKWNPDVEI